MNRLISRLNDKQALIGILGLGYVGLPLMLRFSEVGYRVLGLDIDPVKVDKLNAGQSYIEHISPAAIATASAQGFSATTDFSRARECDALILCVPTPLNKYREPDLSYVLAATKPFGFTPYYPGPGLGGHCIPIDPFYLTWKAREYGLSTRFIELAGEVNANMPQWVVGKVVEALNDRGQALKGARVLVLGIAYEKNVDDMRESPAVLIMEILQHKGAVISYSDPQVPVFPKMRKHSFDLASVELPPPDPRRR